MHEIKALDRLARRAFHQVINCANYNEAVGAGIDLESDITKISTA